MGRGDAGPQGGHHGAAHGDRDRDAVRVHPSRREEGGARARRELGPAQPRRCCHPPSMHRGESEHNASGADGQCPPLPARTPGAGDPREGPAVHAGGGSPVRFRHRAHGAHAVGPRGGEGAPWSTRLAQSAGCPFLFPRRRGQASQARFTSPLLRLMPGGPADARLARGALRPGARAARVARVLDAHGPHRHALHRRAHEAGARLAALLRLLPLAPLRASAAPYQHPPRTCSLHPPPPARAPASSPSATSCSSSRASTAATAPRAGRTSSPPSRRRRRATPPSAAASRPRRTGAR